MPEQILLVDDDQIFRQELKESLDEYRIIEAGSAGEALEILKKPNGIDLILLDFMMPGATGTEILHDIRRISADVKVIIMTGYSSKDVVIEALKGHADEYVEKPVDIGQLKDIISKQLDARHGMAELSACDVSDKIEKVKHFILRNCHKKVTLEDAAMAVCLSPKYISRMFKEKAGVGFNQFKLGIMRDEAKKMLSTTGLRVNQIADKMGYQNVESFIRIFEKMTGFTPSAYRNKYNKRVYSSSSKVRRPSR